jgi:GT2 family glycosyltransferase
MNVTAIIVNYYSSSFLQVLIESLLREECVDQILVIDNSEELSRTAALCPERSVEVVVNERNRGFGAAVNQGVKRAEGEWILVLNPDMKLEEGCLRLMLNAAREYSSPLIGPRSYWDDHHVFRLPPAVGACLWLDTACMAASSFKIDAELYSFYWTLRHERFWDETRPFFEPFLSGGCLLIQKEWIDSLGGGPFDERFFLYYEDTDLCVRALQRNVRPICVPRATVIHYYDQSPSTGDGKQHYMMEAHVKFLRKYYGEICQPALNAAATVEGMRDMAEIVSSPTLEVDEKFIRPDNFFELGLNPYFVPFAQAKAGGAVFEFPADIWRRLSPGRYYARIRNRAMGTLVSWTWQKI